MNRSRSFLLVSTLAVAGLLTACSNSAEPKISATPDCVLLDPVAAASTPLSTATRVELRTNDVAGAASATTDINAVVILERDNNGGYALETLNLLTEPTDLTDLRIVDGELFVRYTSAKEWSALGAAGSEDLAEQDTAIDDVVIGEASIAPGAYQLNDTLSASFKDWSSWSREEGIVGESCEFKYSNTNGSTITVHVDANQRLTRFFYANTAVRADLRVSYEPVTIAKPTDVSEASPDENREAIIEQDKVASVTTFAQTIDREIRSIAAQTGDSPQASKVLRYIVDAGDLSGEFSITGITAAGTTVEITPTTGELPDTLQYLEVSRDGVKVCMKISTNASTASSVTQNGCTW
jgi:hypothetical protein